MERLRLLVLVEGLCTAADVFLIYTRLICRYRSEIYLVNIIVNTSDLFIPNSNTQSILVWLAEMP